MNNYKIIDTPWNTTPHIECLQNTGIETVIRYYNINNYHSHPQKRMEKDEALALSQANMNIMIIFQEFNNDISDFSLHQGIIQGTWAYNWAKNVIGQPSGSAIYFAVDFNPDLPQIKSSIVPYFKGIKKAFSNLSNDANYKVGVYGSGLVTKTLKENNLAEYRWLSESTSFHGTGDAIRNKEYELYQKYTEIQSICGLKNADFDVKNTLINDVKDIGAFMI